MISSIRADFESTILDLWVWDLVLSAKADDIEKATDVPAAYVRELLRGRHKEGDGLALFVELDELGDIEIRLAVTGVHDGGIWGEAKGINLNPTASRILAHYRAGGMIDDEVAVSLLSKDYVNLVLLQEQDGQMKLTVAYSKVPADDFDGEERDKIVDALLKELGIES